MPGLVWRLNYRNVELYPDTRGQSIGVARSDGECKYYPWLGFIDSEAARALTGARPVKLVVSRYCNKVGLGNQWVDLKPDEYVQGCWTECGVYGVTTPHVRVLTRRSSDSADDA